jgi:quinol monooxygenase YgiN
MNSIGLLVRLVAKPDRAAEVSAFLTRAVKMAEAEPGTGLWCAVALENNQFVIFDSHSNEEGREAHLRGEIAATLTSNASEWFASPPVIEKTTFLSVKLPAGALL